MSSAHEMISLGTVALILSILKKQEGEIFVHMDTIVPLKKKQQKKLVSQQQAPGAAALEDLDGSHETNNTRRQDCV